MAVRHLWGVPVLPHAPRPMRRVRQRRRSHGSSKEEKQEEEEEEEDREVYESIPWTLTMELCAGLCRCGQKPLESREKVSKLVLDGVEIGAHLGASGQSRLANKCQECQCAAVGRTGQVVSGGERPLLSLSRCRLVGEEEDTKGGVRNGGRIEASQRLMKGYHLSRFPWSPIFGCAGDAGCPLFPTLPRRDCGRCALTCLEMSDAATS